MDFSKIKDKALGLKDKTLKATAKTFSYGASKLADSRLTLKTIEDLNAFIQKSKNTKGKDSKTGQEKTYVHKVIVIFADPKGDFFKDLLYMLPVLSAKAFSQNISLKLADVEMKGLHKTAYNINTPPSLVIIENMKTIKIIEGEEKLQKVVKSLDLDINKTIEELEK